MTFPPCFSSSFSARHNSSINGNNNGNNNGNHNGNNTNMLINKLRHQQQQSRLFSTSSVLHYNHNDNISPVRIFKPRSATPDQFPEDTKDSKPEREQQEYHQDNTNEDQGRDMEGNAALMLLELSQIVSKEISADSGCMMRGSIQDIVPKNEAFHQNSKDTHPSDSDTSIADEASSLAIPKSIEIHNRDWGGSDYASTSRSPLKTNGIPHVEVASNSSSSSSSYSALSSTPLSQYSSFDIYSPKRGINRHRTVSLVGDEIIPIGNNTKDDQDISPLLIPLSSPLQCKNLTSFFPLHESPPPRHMFLDQKDYKQEAIRRALLGSGTGAKALSKMRAASSTAAIITPVLEAPRPIISFPSTINMDWRNTSGNLIQNANEDGKGRLPVDLPSLLFYSKTKTQSSESPTVSGVTACSYTKLSKLEASVRSPSAIRKKSEKKQPVHGPRAKKTTPKKQQRQRHSGKKFSWKAYPELENFLITNREEYLSFSAKNYTIQQRDYNNRLTSRLLDHAEAFNYSALFGTCAFSAVRDRIRSYYKSYVQSFKRRKERQEQERLKNLEMDCR